MRKIYLSLLTAWFFSANIFAGNSITIADKWDRPVFDLVGPVISYTPLGQSSCLTIRTFTATITDGDGVNTTPGTRPRVYYQRVGDPNTLAGWKYVEGTNVGSTFTFLIDYALLSGGVTPGQTIQYFVVAQDLNATPNISINSGSFAISPSSVGLTATAFPIGPVLNSYIIINALGTSLTIGSFGDFATLTASGGLFNSINNVGLAGNTTVEIMDMLITENNLYPLSQIQNTGCGAGAVSLLIKPALGVTPIITGSRPNEPIIRILSGNVTIDGSNNGTTSRDLTLKNTNITGPVVILYGSLSTVPLSNSTLKNTICNNGANTTGTVVVSDGTVGGVPGYFNNITIQNNSIQKGLIGILCAANPAAGNGSILVTGNDINSTGANQIGLLGIYTEGLDGAVISNNNIGNFETTVTGPRYGIELFTNSINSTVSGNTISGISYSGIGNALTYGIYVAPGVAASGNSITGNTISNITSSGSNTVFGINVAVASGGISIQKNNISNIKNTNGGGYGAYGIGLSSSITTANISVANNFIYDVAGFGVATLARNGYGIYIGAGGGYKIFYNSININTNQTTGVSSALMIANTVTTIGSLDVRNNIFANTQTGGALAGSRYAIYSASSNNNIFSAIDYNDYYSNGTNLGFIGGARATLTNIQTGFGSNLNSLNVLPNFVSSTNLHLLQAGNCTLVGSAVPIVAIPADIDNEVRDVQSPDMGADEFSRTMATPLACETKIVAAAGTTYIDGSCNRIARVLPSGIDPVSGSVKACVTYDATLQYFNGEPYVQRHYDIEPATGNQTSTSATVTLYFTDADFVNYNNNTVAVWPRLPTSVLGNADPNRTNVKITQFHGVATTTPSKPGFYPGTKILIVPTAANVYWNGAYWAVTFNVVGFSGFYLHTNAILKALPVSVNYITGRRQGNNHLLNWKVTCNSSPRATMTLQRSSDSRNFTDNIYNITADAQRCNQPFDYTDTDPLKGMNYYRLKITDADGKITYSTTVALLNAVKGFDIISIAPNPVVTDNFKLNVASAQAGKMEIIIFDMQGRLVNRQSIPVIAGFNSLPINVGNIAAGCYTLRANMNDEQSKIIRFVKQ